MKVSGSVLSKIRMPLSIKRDAILLPGLFMFNCFIFSPWLRILSEPWLMVVWLYGFISLLPLVWRDRAPVTVFVIQWVLSVVTWPFLGLYASVVGTPLALYAVAAHCNKKRSLLALLASLVPALTNSTVAFRNFETLHHQLESFIPNAIILLGSSLGSWAIGRANQVIQQQVQHLEREREMIQEAVTAERRKIIRELHDIVSETTGKKTIAELRRLLRILEISRHSDHTKGLGERDVQPGLSKSNRADHNSSI